MAIRSFKEKAYAKINLFLNITGKRENGYHDLFSVFQEIDIFDTIEADLDDGFPFDIDLMGSPCEDKTKDLCYKAADAFFKAAAVTPVYMNIRTSKYVPSQAGLGGGSSDAACVLKILQEYYGGPLNDRELLELASSLGADVPFFLHGGTCLCEGIGEMVTELPSLKGLPMILIKPKEGVSTGICFNKADQREVLPDIERIKSEIGRVYNDASLCPSDRIKKTADIMVNDLQPPAEEMVPVIGDLCRLLRDKGSIYSCMTGSGSSCFGVYETAEARDLAYEEIFMDSLCLGCRVFRINAV